MWLHYFISAYIVILGLFLCTGRLFKYKKVVYLFLVFGLFTILSSLRSENVGNDTISYLNIFRRIIMTGDIGPLMGRYEIGYLFLNKAGGIITDNPQIILILTSTIIMIGFSWFFYKYSKIPWLSAFLFYTLGYYGLAVNTIRHSLAIVFILIAFNFAVERKILKFILFVVIAFLFHRTAILFIIVWPLLKLKYNYKFMIMAFVVSIGAYISFPYIFQLAIKVFPTYSYYINSDYLDGDIRLASVMNLLVGFSVLFYGVLLKYHRSKKNIETCGNTVSTINRSVFEDSSYSILITIGVIITFVSLNFNLFDRVGYFFFVFTCVYVPNTVHTIKDKNLRVLNIIIIVLLFFTYYTIILTYRPEWNRIYPYEFFWNQY